MDEIEHMSLRELDVNINRLQINLRASQKGLNMFITNYDMYEKIMAKETLDKNIESYIRYIIDVNTAIDRLDKIRYKQ